MNERAVALGLVSVLAMGLIALFFARYEKEEYEVFVDPGGAASSNPLLAAERFLASLGHQVITRDHFAPSIELPGANDTALLSFPYQALRQEEMDRLLQWVSSGGHLIVPISAVTQDYDPIFTAIGVEVVIRDNDEVALDGSDAQQQVWDASVNPGRQAWGNVAHDNGVSIDFGDNEPLWTVRDQFGNFAGQLAYDLGRVTAVADMMIFRNRWIGDEDHAYVLTRIVGSVDTTGHVWLVHGFGYPSLLSLVVEHAYFLLIAAALLVALVLWWAAQRFGPPIAPPSGARKAFVEHIEASGRFLWRHQQHAQLLQSTQRAFLHDAQRRHPRLRRHNDDKRDRYLAGVCGVSPADATDALAAPASRSHADFLRRIRILQTMWTKL